MIASTLLRREGQNSAGPVHPVPACPTPLHLALPGYRIIIFSAGHQKDESQLISQYLAEEYSLLTATTEKAVEKAMKRHYIDLIILNIGAFEGQGADFCSQLKASSSFSHIPVLLVIDENSILSRMKSLAAGADAFIERPLSGKLLKAQIKNILTNRARIKNHFVYSGLAGGVASTYRPPGKDQLLDTLNGLILENLTNHKLDAAFLARQTNMSRPTLYRKVKSLSHLTPNDLINFNRLSRAAALLASSDHKIAEVSRMAGFGSRANFGKAFLKHFNLTPRAYRQANGQQLLFG
jgi:two-component system, cell cycle response regulator